MLKNFLIVTLAISFSSGFLFAQDPIEIIESRFDYPNIKDKFLGFIAYHVGYPEISLNNKSVGLSISSISLTPSGQIDTVLIINSIDTQIDSCVVDALYQTKGMWLKSDSINENQTFYIQIGFVISKINVLNEVTSPAKKEYNFIEPITMAVVALYDSELPESDEFIAVKTSDFIGNGEYENAKSCVDELIKRNPFNKALYQIRISINRKLNDHEMISKDINKIQSFIPGVSIDQLIN